MARYSNTQQRRQIRAFWRLLEPFAASVSAVVAGLGVAFVCAHYLSINGILEPVATKTPVSVTVHFDLCAGAIKPNCVVDGDTIWFAGQKIRLLDIDTPEVFSPQCAAELALGLKASERLQHLLNKGSISIVAEGKRDRDRYGRQLRVIFSEGQSVGDVLIAEGLARPWDGARRSWCA